MSAIVGQLSGITNFAKKHLMCFDISSLRRIVFSNFDVMRVDINIIHFDKM